MSVELRTFLRIIAVLKHAEEFKMLLKKTGGACERHEDYCKCGIREMCNVALAEVLKEERWNTWKKWNRLLRDMEETSLISTRKVKNPANRPQRMIKLNFSWEESLEIATEKEYEKIKEKFAEEVLVDKEEQTRDSEHQRGLEIKIRILRSPDDI